MILDFEKVRFDGQILKEGMSVRDLQNPTGQPVRIQTIRWTSEGAVRSYSGALGLLAEMTPNREYVAVLEALDTSWSSARLFVLASNGSTHREIPNRIPHSDDWVPCRFMAVYASPRPESTAFQAAAHPFTGYAFATDRGVDIDAATGAILDVTQLR